VGDQEDIPTPRKSIKGTSFPFLLDKSTKEQLFEAAKVDGGEFQEGEELEGDIENVLSLLGFRNSHSLESSNPILELNSS
jgi:hypothetical protein